MTPTLWLAVAFGLINITTFGLFVFDKSAAIAGNRRVPERTLLSFAALGGWLGAKLAQRRYRHKTQKQPFARILNLIVALYLLLLGMWLYLATS